MNSSECIFCKIVAGEIPAARIYEDDTILSFLDIGPVNRGHTLVIPKAHFERVDQCPAQVLTAIAAQLGRIAQAVVQASACEAYNVLCNNGRAAGQVVDHVHFHIIPRNSGDGVLNRWPSFKYPEGKAEALATSIRENL